MPNPAAPNGWAEEYRETMRLADRFALTPRERFEVQQIFREEMQREIREENDRKFVEEGKMGVNDARRRRGYSAVPTPPGSDARTTIEDFVANIDFNEYAVPRERIEWGKRHDRPRVPDPRGVVAESPEPAVRRDGWYHICEVDIRCQYVPEGFTRCGYCGAAQTHVEIPEPGEPAVRRDEGVTDAQLQYLIHLLDLKKWQEDRVWFWRDWLRDSRVERPQARTDTGD